MAHTTHTRTAARTPQLLTGNMHHTFVWIGRWVLWRRRTVHQTADPLYLQQYYNATPRRAKHRRTANKRMRMRTHPLRLVVIIGLQLPSFRHFERDNGGLCGSKCENPRRSALLPRPKLRPGALGVTCSRTESWQVWADVLFARLRVCSVGAVHTWWDAVVDNCWCRAAKATSAR